MNNEVRVVFLKETRWAEKGKTYKIGEIESVPAHLFERWRARQIVAEYEGKKESLSKEEAYETLSLKELQKTAKKYHISTLGKNAKQLLKEIGKKRFFQPEIEERLNAKKVIDEIKLPPKGEDATFGDLLNKKGDKDGHSIKD